MSIPSWFSVRTPAAAHSSSLRISINRSRAFGDKASHLLPSYSRTVIVETIDQLLDFRSSLLDPTHIGLAIEGTRPSIGCSHWSALTTRLHCCYLKRRESDKVLQAV